jgi:transcriptional regulator with XRE-family HTH domain
MIALPASNTDTAPDDKVGRRLRHLRKARGLSLRQLADASSLSIGFLSQIERGQSSPSLRTLTRLADSLSVGIGELFADEDEAAGGDRRVVARPADQPTVDLSASGIMKHWVTPFERVPRLDIYILELAQGAMSGDLPYIHEGEEAGLVLEGGIELYLDGRRHLLGEGDSFRFESDRPHRFVNAGGRQARVLWVNYREHGSSVVTPVSPPDA